MRWLHISDIHFMPERDGRSSRELRESLPGYIRKNDIIADEVFFTGDFRHALYQNDTDETARIAANYLKTVAKNAGVTNPSHIHIVPGNHDLTRDSDDKSAKKLKSILKQYDYDNGNFIDRKGVDHLPYLLSRFGFFNRAARFIHPGGSIWPDSMIPLQTYRCCDEYNLLYLNTAVTCGEDEERGNLVLGTDTLSLVLEEITSKNGNLIIALGHHGLGNFTKREQEIIENLFRRYPVHLYLCGDAHKIWHRIINETLEITMGCVKQAADVQAVFSTGEISINGIDQIHAYRWDTHIGGWGPYTQFDDSIKPWTSGHDLRKRSDPLKESGHSNTQINSNKNNSTDYEKLDSMVYKLSGVDKADSLLKAANELIAQEKNVGALKILLEAWIIYQEVTGAESSDTAVTLGKMKTVYNSLNRDQLFDEWLHSSAEGR